MRTLSAKNQSNINALYQKYTIYVNLSDLGLLFSTDATASGTGEIMGISSIRSSIGMDGGLASYDDFEVTLMEAIGFTQITQRADIDYTTVKIQIEYENNIGNRIDLAVGKLDNWEIRNGLIVLHCVSAAIRMSQLSLPFDKINDDSITVAAAYKPDKSQGRWIPVSFGTINKAVGYLIDKDPASNKARVIVNHNEGDASHDSISALTDLFVYFPRGQDYAEVLEDFAANQNGWVIRDSGGGGVSGLTLRAKLVKAPLDGVWGATGTNPLNAVDGDPDTFASLFNPAPDGSNSGTFLAMRLGDLGYIPESILIREDGIYALVKIEKEFPMNDGARTLEDFDFGLEVNNDIPGSSFSSRVLPDGDTAFDNIGPDAPDSETDVFIATAGIAQRVGVDSGTPSSSTDGADVVFPVARLANRRILMDCLEEDPAGGGDTLEEFRIYIVKIRIDMDAPMDENEIEYAVKASFYEDDASGTYTGTNNTVIENPAALAHFIMDKLFSGFTFNTSAIATARTALGSTKLASQILDKTPLDDVIDSISIDGHMITFLDGADISMKALALPTATPDKTFDQAAGDFVSDDGGVDGEIASLTQSSLDDIVNEVEVLYDWDENKGKFVGDPLVLTASSESPIGDLLTESQSRYGFTRRLTIEAFWITDTDTARSFALHVIYRRAFRKRLCTWRTSMNGAEMQVGDLCKLNHRDVRKGEENIIYAGVRNSDLATIKAGATDPQTGAVYKAGAQIEHFEGRHQYRVSDIAADPFGVIIFSGEQADIPFAHLPDPLSVY